MKITDILKLAMKNLTGHKRIMLRVAVSVLTVVLLCCSAAVFVSAVTDELSDIQYKHIDQACAMVSAYSDTAKQAEDTADDIISKITAVSEVISCNVGYQYNIYTTSEYLNSVSQSIDSEDHLVKDITLICGDDMKKTASVDMMRQYKRILAVDMRYDVISENQRISFEHNYPDKQIFLYGRNISGDDEVVISEDFLSELGFTREEMERLTGNRVSLKRTDNGEIYLDGFTVCGIASSEVAASVFGQNSMMITKSAAEKTKLCYSDAEVHLYYDSFQKALEACEQAEKKRYSRNCRTRSYDIFKNRQSKYLYRKDSDCYTSAYMCFNAAVGGIRTFAVLFGHRTENSCDESARSHKNGCVRNNSCGNGSCCFCFGCSRISAVGRCKCRV